MESESSKQQKKQLSQLHQTNINRYSVSRVPSSSHIIESDDEDIMQHLEEEVSNAILTNIFDE